MIRILKKIISRLPLQYQQGLKRIHFGRQIRSGTFGSNEAEFRRLEEWVSGGDWVLDVGANVGHYAAKLSEIVGAKGRVFAFEPVPLTFELLAANMTRLPLKNVSLLNVAASQTTQSLGMSIPKFDTGLDNYYMAEVTKESTNLSVLCIPVDALELPEPIKFAKLDVEGHELSALKGMEKILVRDHPILVVEGHKEEITHYLATFGYSFEAIEGSSNRIYSPVKDGKS